MNKLFADPLPKPDSYANRSPNALKSAEPPSFDVGEIHDTDESPMTAIHTTAIPGSESCPNNLPIMGANPQAFNINAKEAVASEGVSGTESMFAL